MKIKAKLISGVGLLFALIILLAAVSVMYINALKRDTGNILVANYNTLEYARNMLLSLEKMTTDADAVNNFKKHLEKQKTNVTETGEEQVTSKIADHFNDLQRNPADSLLMSLIRQDITELMRLNMQAIERKSSIADVTADNAVLWVSVIGTSCFVIAFILLINLPGNIANPIRELTESIKEIANQNYQKRVHFEDHNEFGDLAESFNIMAKKLEEYSDSKLDKIIKGKKRIDTLINNMHDPVIGVDEYSIVLFANNEALKIAGLKNEQIIGRDINDVAAINDLIRNLITDMANHESKTYDEKLLKIFADDKESYFEKEIIDINIIPTGEKQPQLIGHVIMLRNITLFKELDLAKTNFIGTVSHEFKTPISSMKMSLQLLENENIGSMNTEQKQLLVSITDDTDRLLKITAELLNITQVESGNIKLNVTTTNPLEIANLAIDATRNLAEQKNIKVEVAVEDNLPDIKADIEKTTWVLINLVSNAIRYSFEDSVVTLNLSQKNGKVKFLVKDNGTGISEKYQKKIFDRYFRIPGTQKEGTGLGLAICKEFIEAQGGIIELESELGVGSTFSFTLKSSVNN